MAAQTGNTYISGTTTIDSVKLLTAILEFSTISSSKKESPNNCENDRQSEVAMLAFLAVFVYATHATQAIAFEWKPGFTGVMVFHPANSGFLGLSVLELGRGTRQTDGWTDRHRPSFYNSPDL